MEATSHRRDLLSRDALLFCPLGTQAAVAVPCSRKHSTPIAFDIATVDEAFHPSVMT